MSKRFFILFFSIPLSFNQVSFAQNNVFVTASGSINYIPMKEFSNYIINISNSNVDKVSFGGSITLNYFLLENRNIYVGIEYISSNASFAGGFASLKWNFNTVPISAGYEHYFDIDPTSLSLHLGGGIIYSLFENTENYSGDDGSSKRIFKDSSVGFEVKIGITKRILENISFILETKYRYLGDYSLNTYNNFETVNLSGIGLLIGVSLNLI